MWGVEDDSTQQPSNWARNGKSPGFSRYNNIRHYAYEGPYNLARKQINFAVSMQLSQGAQLQSEGSQAVQAEMHSTHCRRVKKIVIDSVVST